MSRGSRAGERQGREAPKLDGIGQRRQQQRGDRVAGVAMKLLDGSWRVRDKFDLQ